MHPEVKPKAQHKVSLKRGLRCTREMAIDYLDQLAALLIETGIAPSLRQKDPGVWVGSIDTSRMWAHNETPQFINFNSSGQPEQTRATSAEGCVLLHHQKVILSRT